MTTKTYYFVKTQDGRYLQNRFDARTGQMEYWLTDNTKRAWTPCCESSDSAARIMRHAQQQDASLPALVVVEEVL